MNNRRNYYRLLHVQPEAPDEIIKASYRSLMTKLRMHPDLGGDHDQAVLINQAYAVLSDPHKRRKYDESLKAQGAPAFKKPSHETPPSQANRASQGNSNTYQYAKNTNQAGQKGCLFCGYNHNLPTTKYCNCCSSPQFPLPYGLNKKKEMLGRRTSPRINKAGNLTFFPSWPHTGYSAHLRDLSTSGLSMITAYKAVVGQSLKIESPFFKGIVRVVTVRPNANHFSVHVAFLTAEFVTKAGVFVAETA